MRALTYRTYRTLLAMAVVLSSASCRKPVTYADARAVVNRRCLECHAEKPTSRAFPVAPKAVMFDTALEMKKYATRIAATAADGSMPLANMTNMTNEERDILARWFRDGAKIP